MKKLVKKRELITMDLTPLIDVVFLLLVFFIVASEFKKNETVLNLSLPTSSSQQKVTNKQEVMIEISRDKLALNGKKLNITNLENKLSLLKKDTPLNIKIDKEVQYKRVISFLNLLNKLNLNNLLLITKEKQ